MRRLQQRPPGNPEHVETAQRLVRHQAAWFRGGAFLSG